MRTLCSTLITLPFIYCDMNFCIIAKADFIFVFRYKWTPIMGQSNVLKRFAIELEFTSFHYTLKGHEQEKEQLKNIDEKPSKLI